MNAAERRNPVRTRAGLRETACAALVASCLAGCDSYTPPPRPDTLHAAYASLAEFCTPPQDPPGAPLPARADACRVPLGPHDSVPEIRALWLLSTMRCVVRDQEQLRTLWTLSQDTTPAPVIDFGTRMLVLAASGRRGASGSWIRILGPWQRGDTLIVPVDEYSSGRGCMGPAAITTPAHGVLVPRAAVVRFHETADGDDCV